MDAADYLFGCAALFLGLAPWMLAARRLTRRVLSTWQGPEHALAASVLGVSGVVVVTELIGICDGLRRWPWAIVSGLVGLGVARLGVGASPAERTTLRLPEGRTARVTMACVAVCVVATSATMLGRDAAAVRTGPLDADSLQYHLAQAAQMVHTHNIDHLYQTESSDASVYYPYDAELLDAFGMLGPRPDLAVFALNLLFGWLALLACWVIGARWSRGAPALAAGAAVIALPIVSRASSGPGLNDLQAMASLLSALAVLSIAGSPRADGSRRVWGTQLTVAGAALGLAAGTKLNALPLVVLLAVSVVVLARGDRRLATLALAGPALLTGGFWYLRDWVSVGSPVPEANLTIAGHGFHSVPSPEIASRSLSVAHYLGDAHVVRHWFIPGLHYTWTILWPVVGLVAVVGVVLAVFDRSWLRRLVGVAAAIGFLVYLATPTGAFGPEGVPFQFASNTRYALSTAVIAVVLFATSPRLARFGTALTAGFTALTIALLLLSSTKLSAVDYPIGTAVAIALGAVVGAGWLAHRGLPAPRLLAGSIVLVLLVGAGALVQHSYDGSRYAGETDQAKLFHLVGGFHDARIGVAGFGLAYPFFGESFQNTVNHIGVTAASHAFGPPRTCEALLGVLRDLDDDYVVVEPLPGDHTDELNAWLAELPGAVEVLSNSAGVVYRMPQVIPDRCGATP